MTNLGKLKTRFILKMGARIICFIISWGFKEQPSIIFLPTVFYVDMHKSTTHFRPYLLIDIWTLDMD